MSTKDQMALYAKRKDDFEQINLCEYKNKGTYT